MCSSPQLSQQPTGSVNLGKISILQLTLQPFDGYVLPTFISRRVCKLINIFFHSLSPSLSPSGKYLFPQKWAWANLPRSSICCQLPIKWAGTLKLIATPSSLLCLLFLSFNRNERSWGWGGGCKVGGCLRKIKTYSGGEERWWLRHKPGAVSPLFCLSTQSASCLSLC